MTTHPTSAIVIIGSGLSGYGVAREVRRHKLDTPLVVISRDAGAFYSKPMLSNALSANKSASALIMKTADRMAAELNATVHAHTAVTSIDPERRTLLIHCPDGVEAIAWRDLVLAVGADPIRLPLPGDAADEVLSVNDLDDFARFSERLDGVRSVAILGGGLIGCEFANDLLARTIEPTIIDIAPWPLGRLLPETAARWFQAHLEAAGVRFRLGTSANELSHAASGYRLRLSDGSAINADLVMSAVGLRPRTALAAGAGLAVDRGITTGRALETSRAHVYAVGDCAQVCGLILPFVMPIMHQARALGATLCGVPTPLTYPAMPVVVKTPACPTVVCPPPPGGVGQWRVEHDNGAAQGLEARFVDSDGSLLGFALMGSATSRKQALTSQAPPMLA